ncbi:unnamed protein product, partial [Sphagnum balticum]
VGENKVCENKIIIIILITLLAAVQSSQKPTYTVIAPAKIRPNSDYHVSVSIHDTPNPVELDVTISGPSDSGSINSVSKTVVVNSAETRIMNFEIGEWTKGNYRLIVKGRGGLEFSNETTLEFEQKSYSVFIQTDKAIYKPSQLVQFRVILVNPSLLPAVTGAIDIYIKDSKGNRVKQWSRLLTKKGVAAESLQLSDQPVLGDWTIHVEVLGQKFQKSYTVAEYVLPTFDVEVKLPPYATYNKSDVIATIKAIYTYGKPVKGEVTLTVQPKIRYNMLAVRPLEQFQTKTAIDGSVDIPVNIIRDLNLKSDFFEREIEFFALVEEGLTGRKYNKSSTIKIFDKETKVELIKTSKTFKPGLKYTCFLKVAYQDDTPVEDNGQPLLLRYGFSYNFENWTEIMRSVPVKGMIKIDIFPPKSKDVFVLGMRAEYKGQTYYLESVESAQSPSNNFIQVIKNDERDAKVGQEVKFEVNATEPLSRLVYEVMGRGDIVLARSLDIPNSNSYQFSFMTTHHMAPKARIVVYYVRAGNQELVADALNFDVDGVFRTHVIVDTNVRETKPGAMVDVRVSTKPNAFVGVLGVDQSVLLLKSGNDITQEEVIKELESYDAGKGDNFNVHPYLNRGKRSIWWPGSTTTGEIFDDSGVVVLSNGLIHKNFQWIYYRMSPDVALYASAGRGESELDSGLSPPHQQSESVNNQRVRKQFPETWLWNSTITGFDGNAVITSQIPDTITSWFISAFAMDQISGLGISQSPAKITVFRPFFIKLSLPYSLIRGESVAIQAIVFNYMNKPVEAEVTMENKRGEFEFTNSANELDGTEKVVEEKRKFIRIEANDGVSVSFLITPTKVGYIDIKMTASSDRAGDAVLQKLLVKPEGQPQYFNRAVLLDLKDTAKSEKDRAKNISVNIPSNAIPGSEKVTISGIGDILGPTVNNIDDLLRMPYGCGEQNMINLVPNIVILDYLSRANRLTPSIKSKAITNIESGYQRELTYQRADGSFSAFGNNDKSGSTWLTAFVTKSFTQAKPHVDIDQKVIYKATEWLFNRQNSDGSFSEPGEVHHKALQGGSSAGSGPLTAYVMISLLQDKDIKKDRKSEIQRAEGYIWNEFTSTRKPYEMALTAFALELAESRFKDNAYNRLMSTAKKTSEYTWWADDDIPETNLTDKQSAHFFYPQSNDVEGTAYALLTLVSRGDIENAIPVLKWLISKQNSNGGFSSTQDTVVGIQALGALASRISTSTVSIDVTFKYKSDDDQERSKQMRIDSNNAMVLQRIELPATTKYITVQSSGFGSAILQVSWQYNLAVSAEQPSFYLSPQRDKTSTENYLQLSVCTYFKAGNSTNMAVMEVELPSGYVADVDHLHSVTRAKEVKRIDTTNGDTNVVVYFDR